MAETEHQAPKDESVLEEAQSLLVQGKRAMALEDYQSATDMLEQAVQLFDAFYGVARIPCADAYLEYGLALVALANLEAGSGTDRLMKKAGIEDADEDDEEEGDDEEEEEEEKEEEEEEEEEEGDGGQDGGKQSQEASITNGVADGKLEENGSHEKTNGQTNGDSTNGAKEADEEPMQTSTSEQGPTPGTSSGRIEGVDDKDSDDVDNEEATTIEVAWEVLNLARKLFMKDESLEGRMKLAETLQKLGEISIEWDNNENAVDILKECLEIRKAILSPEDRLIALTFYNLGLAHSFKSDIQSANENFQFAINVIEKRIESLNKDLERAKAGQDTMAVSTYEREINELKEILPDITMRMDDSKEDEATSSEVLKRTRDEIQQEDEEVKKVCLDSTKAVDDISHLVKRKAT